MAYGLKVFAENGTKAILKEDSRYGRIVSVSTFKIGPNEYSPLISIPENASSTLLNSIVISVYKLDSSAFSFAGREGEDLTYFAFSTGIKLYNNNNSGNGYTIEGDVTVLRTG